MSLKYALLFLALTCVISYTNANEQPQLHVNVTAASVTLRPRDIVTIFECWNTLIGVRSCASDILGFFGSGRIDRISTTCTRTIKTVTNKCWPVLLAALGEECSILVGFCDPSSTGPSAKIPVLPPSEIRPASHDDIRPAKMKETKV